MNTKQKKALYESIMKQVSISVKRAIEESYNNSINEKQVFHGGSSNFDKFDTKFMGTGEGAQVYGWGIYLTDSESLGEFYIRNAIFNGAQRSSNQEILNLFRKKDKKVFIDKSKLTADKDGNLYGYLYAVDIPDDNGKNYIDWNLDNHDKLIEIYNKIKSKLNDRQKEFIEEEFKDKSYHGLNPIKKVKSVWKHHFDEIKNFSRLYSDLSYVLGSPKNASLLLDEFGFDGIKVPMGNRSSKTNDGFNYIIFNTDKLSISGKRKITYDAKHANRAGGNLNHKFIKNITELPIK